MKSWVSDDPLSIYQCKRTRLYLIQSISSTSLRFEMAILNSWAANTSISTCISIGKGFTGTTRWDSIEHGWMNPRRPLVAARKASVDAAHSYPLDMLTKLCPQRWENAIYQSEMRIENIALRLVGSIFPYIRTTSPWRLSILDVFLFWTSSIIWGRNNSKTTAIAEHFQPWARSWPSYVWSIDEYQI